MTTTKQITFFVPEKVHTDFKTKCVKNKWTMQAVLELLVMHYLRAK